MSEQIQILNITNTNYLLCLQPTFSYSYYQSEPLINFQTLKYVDSDFEHKLDAMKHQIYQQMLQETPVFLLIILDLEYCIRYVEQLQELYQFKQFFCVIMQPQGLPKLEISFLHDNYNTKSEEAKQYTLEQISSLGLNNKYLLVHTNISIEIVSQYESNDISVLIKNQSEMEIDQKQKSQEYWELIKSKGLIQTSKSMVMNDYDQDLIDKHQTQQKNSTFKTFKLTEELYAKVDHNHLYVFNKQKDEKLMAYIEIRHQIKSIEYIKQLDTIVIFQNYGIIGTYKLVKQKSLINANELNKQIVDTSNGKNIEQQNQPLTYNSQNSIKSTDMSYISNKQQIKVIKRRKSTSHSSFSFFSCLSAKPQKQYIIEEEKQNIPCIPLTHKLQEIMSLRVKTAFSETCQVTDRQILIGTKTGLNIYELKSSKDIHQVVFEMFEDLQILQIFPIYKSTDHVNDSYPHQFLIGCRKQNSYQVYKINITTLQYIKLYEFNCFIDIQLECIQPFNNNNFQGLLLEDSKRYVVLDCTNINQVKMIDIKIKETHRKDKYLSQEIDINNSQYGILQFNQV